MFALFQASVGNFYTIRPWKVVATLNLDSSYVTFKYFAFLTICEKFAITCNKFRLGNHRLHIETGRYTVPKTPEHLRICSLCQANEDENECHVMFSCTLYDTLCSKFLDEIITSEIKNFVRI